MPHIMWGIFTVKTMVEITYKQKVENNIIDHATTVIFNTNLTVFIQKAGQEFW